MDTEETQRAAADLIAVMERDDIASNNTYQDYAMSLVYVLKQSRPVIKKLCCNTLTVVVHFRRPN